MKLINIDSGAFGAHNDDNVLAAFRTISGSFVTVIRQQRLRPGPSLKQKLKFKNNVNNLYFKNKGIRLTEIRPSCIRVCVNTTLAKSPFYS